MATKITSITRWIGIFERDLLCLEQKGKFSLIPSDYEELKRLSTKIDTLKYHVPESAPQLAKELTTLQNRIQLLQDTAPQPQPIPKNPTPHQYAPRTIPSSTNPNPSVTLGPMNPYRPTKSRNQYSPRFTTPPYTPKNPTPSIPSSSNPSNNNPNPNVILGSINQYGRKGNPPSCTSNALSFLSFAMSQAGKNIRTALTPNKVDQIVREGIEKFEVALSQKKARLERKYNKLVANSEIETANDLKAQFAGDIMGPFELVDFYCDKRGNAIFGDRPRSPSPQRLPPDFSDRTNMFIGLIHALETQHLHMHGVVGTTITSNEATSSLALVKNSEGTIQYCIFDSHGAKRLNGSDKAFVYVTTNKEEAARYLASLVKYIVLNEDFAMMGLTLEEQALILADDSPNANQLAITIQVPAFPRGQLDYPPPEAESPPINRTDNPPMQPQKEGLSPTLITTISAIAYWIFSTFFFLPIMLWNYSIMLWNYYNQEPPRITPSSPPETPKQVVPTPTKPDTPVKKVNREMPMNEKEEALINFYLSDGRTYRADRASQGFTFNEIMAFYDDQMEEHHDFIQWLFPTVQPSGPNPNAPTATDAIIIAFRDNVDIQKRLWASFNKMLTYYGLMLDSSGKVLRAANFNVQAKSWINGGHNLLRMTRMINSLAILGRPDLARSFYEALEAVYFDANKPKPLSSSMGIWAKTIVNCIPGYQPKFYSQS